MHRNVAATTNAGNMAICRAKDPKGPVEANCWCQNWFNPHHTRSGFSVDKNADGTWHSHLETGVSLTTRTE